MNKVILTGCLAKDPEISYDQNAHVVCHYSLLINRSFSPYDNESDVDLINCVTYTGWAEFVEEKLKKGMLVTVVGELQVNTYASKRGRKQKKTEVVTTEHYLIPDHYEDRSDRQDGHRISTKKLQKKKPIQPMEPTKTDLDFIFQVDDDELPF